VTCTPNGGLAFDGGHCHGCTGSASFGVGEEAIPIRRRQFRIHVGIDLISPHTAIHHQFILLAEADDLRRSPTQDSPQLARTRHSRHDSFDRNRK
jgi:hypothetical protein